MSNSNRKPSCTDDADPAVAHSNNHSVLNGATLVMKHSSIRILI